MLSEAFVSVLSARRADYNAQFLAARRAAPELTEEAFKEFLVTSLDPLVSAVAAVDRNALLDVVDTAYGVGLELLSQRLAGPRAHTSAIDAGFQELFPAFARLIARAPAALLPRLCNALHQLSTVPGARVSEWCSMLLRLSAKVTSVEELLGLGQVCGWLSGLAHYRAHALALCRSLPEALVLDALGVRGAELAVILARLEADPWFEPRAPEAGFRVAGTFGAFRGLGGSFLEQPCVLRVGQALFVTSGEDAWLVTLDAFGCTLHRARPEELKGATHDVERGKIVVEPTRLRAFGRSLPLPDTGAPRSAVGNASTLLLTTAHSYAVTIVALEREA